MQPGQQQQPGTDVMSVYDPAAQLVTGLEDFDESDLRLPRLSIDHENGGFIDSLNPENVMPKIQVIPLGLVKQRIMWPALMVDDGDDSNPMCKSVDHKIGYPNITSTEQRELFPWSASGWEPNQFPRDEHGRITLPCDSCRFKEWKSHPDGKKTWCSEQHAIILLYAPYDDDEGFHQEPSMLALFTAQRSSINASKGFFAGMFRQQLPAFAFVARWSLRKEQRGKNTYYTPLMTITGKTDQADWPGYSAPYVEVRSFITQPPRVRDDQQQAMVSGALIAQQNQMAPAGGFQNTTWAPGQPTAVQQQPQVIQAVPVQQYQQPVQPQVQQVQPQQAPVDPAYLEWQRQQAVAAQAQQPVQPQVQQPVATPVSTPPSQLMEMPSPFAGQTPVTPAPSAPTTGRDDEEPLPF